MFQFPSSNGVLTPQWLNADPHGGQGLPSVASAKADHRRRARILREQSQQEAIAAGLPWGQSQLNQLDAFLLLQFQGVQAFAMDGLTRSHCWAAYFAIGSELNLIDTPVQRSWWMPHALSDGSLNWYPWSPDIIHWPKDHRNIPIPAASCHPRPYRPTEDGPWIVFTPCLAADRHGFRLGYGGGYYDRFLSLFGHNILSVACVPQVCWWQNDVLPREAHDQPVDLIVTERTVHVVNPETLKKKLALFNC